MQPEVVPPSTSLVYVLRVLSAAKQKDVWEMTNAEKVSRMFGCGVRGCDWCELTRASPLQLAAAEQKRAEGNAAFTREQYNDAERLYNLAVQTLDKVTPEDEGSAAAVASAKVRLHLLCPAC